MNKLRWKSMAKALALSVGLVLMTNPEIRALLLVADAIGLEALALLVLVHLRGVWPLVAAHLRRVAQALCPLIRGATQALLHVMAGLLGSCRLLAPTVAYASMGLACVRCPGRASSDRRSVAA